MKRPVRYRLTKSPSFFFYKGGGGWLFDGVNCRDLMIGRSQYED